MLATLLIFLAGLMLVTLLGMSIEALLTPGEGVRLRPRTPAIGFATAAVAGGALGAVMPVSQGAWVLILTMPGIAGVALMVHWRVRATPGAHNSLATSLRRILGGRGVLLPLGVAVILAGLALIPLLKLGFPSTIATANNDGFQYAGVSDWLLNHRWTDPPGTPQIYDIYGGAIGNQLRDGFGVGFETISSILTSLIGRPSYQVVQPLAAVGFVVAAGGWYDIARQVRPALTPARLSLVGIAVATPAFVTLYSENYFPHAMGVALVPLCIAGIIEWHSRPSLSALARTAISLGSVLVIYPGVLPWVLGPWGLIAVHRAMTTWRAEQKGAQAAGVAAARVGAVLLAPVIATFLVAPYRVAQAVGFLTDKVSTAPVPYPSLGKMGAWAFVTGATGPLPVLGLSHLSWLEVTAALVLTLVTIAGFVRLCTTWSKNPRAVLAAVGVLIVTVVGIVQYSSVINFDYGIFKVLATGGSLLAGFILIGILIPSSGRGRVWTTVGLTAVSTLWALASAGVLSAAFSGIAGFRADDVTVGRRIALLPAHSVVLVEGTTDSAQAFHSRMSLMYIGPVLANTRIIGLGSTGTYYTPPGSEPWVPALPWDYVLASGDESVTPSRIMIWRNAQYMLWKSPAIDATPYGTAWYPVEIAPDGSRFRWIAGKAEIVVSNRSNRERHVLMTGQALAWGRKRSLRVTMGSRLLARIALSTQSTHSVFVPFVVPAHRVVSIKLDGGAPSRGPGTDARRLSARMAGLTIRGSH